MKDFASSKLNKVVGSLNSMQRKVEQANNASKRKFNETTTSINSLQQRLEVLNRQRGATTSISQIKDLNRNIRGTQRELTKLDNLPKPTFVNRLRNIGSQMGGLVGLAGGFAVALAGWNAIKSVFNKGVELEQMEVKFEVLLGSVEKSQKMLKDLNQYANFTPYDNKSITKSAELQLAFGVVQEDIMGNMRMLGDVAMGDKNKLQSLNLAFSQMSSTGRLMGQDLLQMVNVGFNPLQVISENTGLSMFTLKKQMEAGAISSDMVSEAFRLATSEGGKFNGMSDRMAETAGGKMSTLLGKASFVVMTIGKRLSNLIAPLIDVGIAVVENIIPFVRSIQRVYKWITASTPLLILFGGIIAVIAANFVIANAVIWGYSIALGAIAFATKIVTIATQAWNFVLNMNPIGLVILAITALIASIVYLWNRFDWFRGMIMGVWEVIKGLGTVIKDYLVNRFVELLKGVTGIGKALVAFFNGDFKKAWEIGKNAATDLMGNNSAEEALKSGAKAFAKYGEGYNKGIESFKPKTIDAIEKGNPEAERKKQKRSALFDPLGDPTAEGDETEGSGSGSSKADSTISGGSKRTNINITIGKLQDDTKIFVNDTESGLDQLGDKVQEILLRAINSVNNLQTS
jgi:tape measure domain-containing protein